MSSIVLGTSELMTWLDRNPLVEFQSIDQVCSPTQIGRNSNFVTVFHAQKVDLFGRIVFPVGKGSVTAGPGVSADLLSGAEISPGGYTVFGLPSRNSKGKPNILVKMRDLRNQFHMRESIDIA